MYTVLTNNIAVNGGRIAHLGETITATECPDVPGWIASGLIKADDTPAKPTVAPPAPLVPPVIVAPAIKPHNEADAQPE